ncbi:MAG: acyltransferase [Eubacterium sp.]|nr:acyltransferase [Eubacterium sp.]
MKNKNYAIQGLRFWAISLIIASHCGFLAQGGVGNNIFFVISGFFACHPFSDDDYEKKYFKFSEIIKYYINRFFRIIPIMWLCLFFATWGLRFFTYNDFSTENSLLLNMFFIKSRGHLWFLQQEMVFYVIVPFIIILFGLLKCICNKVVKNPIVINGIVFAFISFSVYITFKFLPRFTSLYLFGNGVLQPLKLWLFLIGMSFSYLFRLLKLFKDRISDSVKSVLCNLSGIYVFLFLLFTILSSEHFLTRINEARFKGYYIGWEHPIMLAYMASFVVLALVLMPSDNFVCVVMGNKLFKSIGDYSFIMYLLHFFFLQYFSGISVKSRLLSIYVISFCMAYVIHNYIEKPIIAFIRDKLSDKKIETAKRNE